MNHLLNIGEPPPGGNATEPLQTASQLLVSVVVPTFHRPALLAQCLQALVAQSLAQELFEILVCDDGRSDATREQVLGEASRHREGFIRYVRFAHGEGPAAARNHGWRSARAPLIAFTDDDTRPDADWLQQGVIAMQSHACEAVSGRTVVPRSGDLAGNPPTDHERMTQGLAQAQFVTANAFVRTAVLHRLNGFDERFERAWREDSDLQFMMEEAGMRIMRCDAAVVLHPVRPERWGVSLRQQRNVFFDALLYAKHPRHYRQRIRRVPPWDYYAIVAFSAAALALLAWGRHAGALLCLCMALVLVLALAARRLRGTSHAPAHVLEMLVTSLGIPYLSVYWRLRGAWHFEVLFL